MSVATRILSAAFIGFLVCGQLNEAQGQTQPRIRPKYGQGQADTKAREQRPATGKIVEAHVPRVPVVPSGPPKEFQLTDAQQKRVDDMLKFWQQKTEGIETLSAKFGRWVYDPVFGPKNAAAKFTSGEIRYAAVDKGMIREQGVYVFDPTSTDKKFPFKESESIGEHWVCTGASVFEYDHKAKKLNEIKLPAAMQGKAIAEGPLPFMFGAKAESIKKRYWIREIPRKNEEAPYHLELLPRLPGEIYSLVRIKLDAKKFLPTEMVLIELNKMGRSSYAFKDMKANHPTHKVNTFLNRFIAPKVPNGYQLVVHEPPVQGTQRPRQEQAQGAQPDRR